ncbi:hypothetical protein [Ruegeria atlantica]|uniref:hypothetical protein n=1 Tax=Ruegeria atlantica TaxID=81569 RepID=UPI002494F6E2|nr:hypothetical protein [Ruegeria atlantica]
MRCVPSIVLMAVIPASAIAQQDNQTLASQASDPTASLMLFQLQNFYSPSLHNANGALNVTQFRAAIPFQLVGISNIARLTLPSVTYNSNGDTGIGDATLFNLAAFDRSWGRYGVGVVALLPTGAGGVSAEKWGLGPALGFVARPGWGLARLFNQNILTVAGDNTRPDVNISTLQPIVSYTIDQGWSVGTSDMTVVYDWDRSEFTSLPIGLKVSKLSKLGGVPVQWQLSYERNFYDAGTGPQDTIGLTAKLLVPK